MSVFFQLIGIADGALGLYGYYTGNMTFLVAGLVVAFLFCKMNQISVVEHMLTRIIILPFLSLPGMLICHFAVKMTWGMGFLLCFNWVLAITAVIFLFVVIKERREMAGGKKRLRRHNKDSNAGSGACPELASAFSAVRPPRARHGMRLRGLLHFAETRFAYPDGKRLRCRPFARSDRIPSGRRPRPAGTRG